VNGETRESRLVKSIGDYVRRSISSILKAFFVYKPGKTFFLMGLIPGILGVILTLRWVLLYFGGTDRAHVPSLVAAAVLLLTGLLFWVAGLLGELFAINRRLLQDVQYMLRRQNADQQAAERLLARREAEEPPAIRRLADGPPR
jgi:hypothetical protein